MRLPLLLAPVLLIALTACGGSKPPQLTAAQKKHCTVRIYFARGATHTQERHVGSKLRKDARVAQVTFISKAQALAEMKKKFPDLFNVAPPYPGNPLPDAFTVLPVDVSRIAVLGRSIGHAHWPGVADVNWPGRGGLPSRCPK